MSSNERRGHLFTQGLVTSVTKVLAVVVLLCLGVALGRLTSVPGAASVADGSEHSGPQHPGPTRFEDGVASGYAPTPDGAIAAAANYTVVLGGQANLDPAFGRTTYPLFTLPEMARDLLARSEDFASRVPDAPRLATDPALVLRAAPVGYRLEQFTGSEARVAVWAVAIGAGVPGLPLTTAWGTEVLTLRWVAGDWRIAAIDRSSGPVPPGNGGEAAAVATARMQQFRPFGYGPGAAP